jgi:hypothetical protein
MPCSSSEEDDDFVKQPKINLDKYAFEKNVIKRQHSPKKAVIKVATTSKKPPAAKKKPAAKKESKTPKQPRKPRKVTKASEKKKQPDIRKALTKYNNDDEIFNNFMIEHSRDDGVDADELQMALALSKSEHEQKLLTQAPAESPSIEECMQMENRIKGIKKNLESYGFVTTSKPMQNDLVRRRKRYKCTKPRLLRLKTVDEINELVAEKAAKYLKTQKERRRNPVRRITLNIFSEELVSMFNGPSNILAASRNKAHTDRDINIYYVGDLFEPTKIKAGYMLRDWSKLPGRDPTPEREAPSQNEDPVFFPSQESGTDDNEAVIDLVEDAGLQRIRLSVPKRDLNRTLNSPDIFEESEDDLYYDVSPLGSPAKRQNTKDDGNAATPKKIRVPDVSFIDLKSILLYI